MEAQDVEEPGVQVRQAGLRERRRIGALRQAAELEPVQVEREGVEPVEPGGQARQHLIAVRRRQTPIANGLQPVVDEVAQLTSRGFPEVRSLAELAAECRGLHLPYDESIAAQRLAAVRGALAELI